MNKALVTLGTVGVVAALGAGGYFWAQHEGEAQLRAATDSVRASLGPQGSFSYTGSQVHPFSRAADLSGVAMRMADGRLYTADQVNLTKVDHGRVGTIHVKNLQHRGTDGSVLTVETMDARDVTYPPPLPGAPAAISPGAVTFAEMTMRKLRAGSLAFSASIDSATLGNYGAGRGSNLVVDGFSAPVPSVQGVDRIEFARLSMSGLDLASLVDAASRGTQPPNIAGPKYTVAFDNLLVANGDTKVGEIARAEVSGEQAGGPGAQTGRLAATGISITVPKSGPGAEYTSTLPDVVRGDLQIGTTYNAAGGVLGVEPFSLNVEGVGKLDATFRVLHVDLGAFSTGEQPSPAAIEAMVSNAQLALATVSLEDKGLRNQVYALGQAQTGATPAQLAEFAAQAVTKDAVLRSLPNGADIARAVSNFLRNGGRIEFAARPQQPLGFGDFQTLASPQAAAKRLGLQARSEAAPPASAVRR
ncbi:hypothetical protein [Pseudoroseomonas ludipueritiae]|uniref:DUF945 domain-containing protein n=1 Tax=Pseudoroseomonas ludipueritiae TaxID=198093 RepID=A0ABR7R398_9PROT|nr:hypothetical protein [Pseudoroseomonas ludipueritiae]MBC9176200.1 hypothetical protein [Pseudoroseomonas ludipueritiae]